MKIKVTDISTSKLPEFFSEKTTILKICHIENIFFVSEVHEDETKLSVVLPFFTEHEMSSTLKVRPYTELAKISGKVRYF